MKGKSKCKILKDIRRQIAQDNDIEYITSDCKFQGDCSGTCPKCEAELRYLEDELKIRQKAGKKVAIAGIAATLMVNMSGCDLDNFVGREIDGDVVPRYEVTQPVSSETDASERELIGTPNPEVTPPCTDVPEDEFMGEALPDNERNQNDETETEIFGGIEYLG
ncbi:MAG: hypothetical protein IJZ94_03990 [Clostridia bacterium]|nr:hypothetical protein [Clostridia bacterium]